MSSKNTTEVIIGGKVFTLGGYESEEYLQKIASYINNKLAEFGKDENFRKQSAEIRANLMYLNVADDYFKAKKQAEIFEQDLQQKDQEMYDLKHELISLKMQIEEAKKAEQEAQDQKNLLDGKVKELEKELDELLK